VLQISISSERMQVLRQGGAIWDVPRTDQPLRAAPSSSPAYGAGVQPQSL
jgi:hypothetical protein